MKIIAKVVKAEATIIDEQGCEVMQYSVDNSSFEMDVAAFIAGFGKLAREVQKQVELDKQVEPLTGTYLRRALHCLDEGRIEDAKILVRRMANADAA